jgi:hypothetical protein
MDPADSLKRLVDRKPHEEEPASEDQALAPEVGGGEDLDDSQTAEALKQDPDKVPNRIQEPEPPREEEAGV